ncbi:hypothetical protein D3C85_1552930 [compost metagenome]
MLSGTAHVLAAVVHHSRAVRHGRYVAHLHWTGLNRCLHARHPYEGKRQADQENQAESQVAFHCRESSCPRVEHATKIKWWRFRPLSPGLSGVEGTRDTQKR